MASNASPSLPARLALAVCCGLFVEPPAHATFQPAGGQDPNGVTVFAIDQPTGKIFRAGTALDVPAPVCLRFRSVPRAASAIPAC